MDRLKEQNCLVHTEEELEIIVERVVNRLEEKLTDKAADKAVDKLETRLYLEVGKTFITKVIKLIGVVILGLAFYFTKGNITKIL